MITRFKSLNKTYTCLLRLYLIRNLSKFGRKSNPLLYMELFKKYEKQASMNSAHFLSGISQENQNEGNNKSSFTNKILIATGVLLLIYFKYIEFVDCEKQSKTEKEKCKN